MTYELQLSNFEGPLDLLLSLVSKEKILPKDIFVSEITEQYLSYMKEPGIADLDTASDFLRMAATLLYIKSRALLPGLLPEEEEDIVLLEDALVARLNEYKKTKEASEVLKLLENASRGQFYKLPEELASETSQYSVIHTDIDALLFAYLRMTAAAAQESESPPDLVIPKEGINMQTQIYVILGRLVIKETLDFVELFSAKPSREELAVTFYALLELWAQGKVGVRQAQAFGSIEIYRRKEQTDG